MKKLVILLLAISLFTACNNDKGGKKADYREKDDYSNTDEKKDGDEQSDDKSKKYDNGEDNNGGDGWSEKDKTAFFAECMSGFGGQQDLGKKICPCALVKFEKNYSSFAEASSAPESVGNRIAKDCMQELNISPNNNNNNNNGNDDDDGGDYASGGWSSREVKEFVGGCKREAMNGGMEELDAQSYCDCMQYKIAKIYPSYADANRLTSADLQKPAMKKLIQSCLPGN